MSGLKNGGWWLMGGGLGEMVPPNRGLPPRMNIQESVHVAVCVCADVGVGATINRREVQQMHE